MLNIPEEVKIALRAGDRRKNYKMKVNDVDPDTGERTYSFTIDNNSIVKESVRIDERMATGKYLKFGLCEGASLEFQYFDHPNINGKDIQVFISIEYVDSNDDLAWYDIPMGWFSVDQCPMQWDTGIFKVTAYNKLKSAYLDQKCNTELDESLDDPTLQLSVIGIRNYLLSDYEIKPATQTLVPDSKTSNVVSVSLQIHNGSYDYADVTPLNPYVANEHGRLVGENCYINFGTVTYSYTVTSTFYYQFIEIKRKFIECQQTFIDYVKDIIDKSVYCDTTGAQYIAALDNTTNAWRNLYSVGVNSGGTTKYYSDYAYKNGLSGIDGSIEDLTKIIIENATTVTITIPAQIILDGSSFSMGTYTGRLYGTVMPYYLLGADRVDYPSLKYPDGEIIPRITTSDDYPYADWFSLNRIENLSPADLVLLNPATVPDFTLRDLASATYETVAQYGKLDRETDLFDGVELNQGGLYPQDTLYPADSLYPQGNALHPFPSSYSKLWTDTVGEQSFRYLIITYKTIVDGEETDRTLQRTVNTHGTTNYNMSDNWLFRNLVWTAEDVGTYADAMVEKMRDIRWFPFELWCAGLPHIETGDAIEITDKNGDTHTSYVLTRTLSGVQDLQDTFINGELDIF